MSTIYLLRHGIAVALGERGVTDDQDRMLTAEGIRKSEDVARGIQATGVRVDAVVSSPLLRAAETAAIAARMLTPKSDVEFSDWLLPGCNVTALLDWLAEDGRDLMLVGHMPDLADIASVMLTGDTQLCLTMKKASACAVRFDGPPQAGQGCLEWLMQPRQSRKIG
jgi:phosphohistidine phosphatase